MSRSLERRSSPPHIPQPERSGSTSTSSSQAGVSRSVNGSSSSHLAQGMHSSDGANKHEGHGLPQSDSGIAFPNDKGKITGLGVSSRSRTPSSNLSPPTNGHKLASRAFPPPLSLLSSHLDGTSTPVNGLQAVSGLTVSETIPSQAESTATHVRHSRNAPASASSSVSSFALPSTRDTPVKFSFGNKGKEKDNSLPSSASSVKSRFDESGVAEASRTQRGQRRDSRSDTNTSRRNVLEQTTAGDAASVDDATALAAILGEVEQKKTEEERARLTKLADLERRAGLVDSTTTSLASGSRTAGAAADPMGLLTTPSPVQIKFPALPAKAIGIPDKPSISGITAPTATVLSSVAGTNAMPTLPVSTTFALPKRPDAAIAVDLPRRVVPRASALRGGDDDEWRPRIRRRDSDASGSDREDRHRLRRPDDRDPRHNDVYVPRRSPPEIVDRSDRSRRRDSETRRYEHRYGRGRLISSDAYSDEDRDRNDRRSRKEKKDRYRSPEDRHRSRRDRSFTPPARYRSRHEHISRSPSMDRREGYRRDPRDIEREEIKQESKISSSAPQRRPSTNASSVGAPRADRRPPPAPSSPSPPRRTFVQTTIPDVPQPPTTKLNVPQPPTTKLDVPQPPTTKLDVPQPPQEEPPPPPPLQPPSPPQDFPDPDHTANRTSGIYTWELRAKPAAFSQRIGNGNFRVLYDPALHDPKQAGRGSKGKSIICRYDGAVKAGKDELVIHDPRLQLDPDFVERGHGSRKNQAELTIIPRYSWDENSVGTPPPPPPEAITIIGLHQLTSIGQIRTALGRCGPVEDFDMKLDPRSGTALGICRVIFKVPAEEKTSSADELKAAHEKAHKAAVAAKERCNGIRIGSAQICPDERVKVVMDGNGSKAEQAVKAELARRKAARQPQPKQGAPVAAAHKSSPALGATATSTPSAAPTPSTTLTQNKVAPTALNGFPTNATPPARPKAVALAVRPTSFVRPPPALPFARGRGAFGRMAWQARPQYRPPMMRPPVAQPNLAVTTNNFIANPFSGGQTYGAPGMTAAAAGLLSGRPAFSGPQGLPRVNGVLVQRGPVSKPKPESESGSDIDMDEVSSEEDAPRPVLARVPATRVRPSAAEMSVQEARRLHSLVRNALVANANSYLFVDKKAVALDDVGRQSLEKALGIMKHELHHSDIGWFVLFKEPNAAARAAKLIEVYKVNGRQIPVELKPPVQKDKEPPRAPLAERVASNVAVKLDTKKAQKVEELPAVHIAMTKSTRTNRRVVDSDSETEGSVTEEPVAPPAKPPSEAPQVTTDDATSVGTLDIQQITIPQKDNLDVEEIRGEAVTEVPTAKEPEDIVIEVKSPQDQLETAALLPATKPGQAKRKAKVNEKLPKAPPKKKQKKQLDRQSLDEVSQAVPDEEVRPAPSEEPSIGTLLEDAITDEPQLKAKPKSKAKKAAAPAKPSVFKPATPVSDAIAEGLAEDDEDVYLLALAIKKSRTGDLPAIGEPADEEPEPELKHSTGSARTQGYYKIREVDKSAYLPSRNRAAVEVEASTANAIATATSRSTRVNTRRLVQGMEQHKKATATDTDVFQFNQLRTRKKHLKFSKSPIHDWGLYAMEFIPQGEMVIEYVGEVIRAQVADIREKYYEKTGIGSSYLFRVDDDAVVDATKKGNLGRLINHCCAPNCTAKIITINGEKKIVIYAKSNIEPGEEITYDYHFPIEQEKIVCLCGSSKCRGYLN